MDNEPIFQVEPTCIRDHQAVRAWNQLGHPTPVPSSVEILRTKKGNAPNRKSTIYRLADVGNGGASVIAKRARRESLLVERTVYLTILPALSVSTLHCYGYVDDEGSGFGWLFLEEATGVEFSRKSSEHLSLAAEWLGTMHTQSAAVGFASVLPDHGPDIYLPRLHRALENIHDNITNPALTDADVSFLRILSDHCTVLESRWDEILNRHSVMPRCLVHGDFGHKNVRVKQQEGGLILSVMDWDISGWGAPAVDIEKLDLTSYWTVVRRQWPHLDLDQLTLMANVGVILRNIGLIAATSTGLSYEPFDKTMRNLKIYSGWLDNALDFMEWRS
jgi:hypothetical protein